MHVVMDVVFFGLLKNKLYFAQSDKKYNIYFELHNLLYLN